MPQARWFEYGFSAVKGVAAGQTRYTPDVGFTGPDSIAVGDYIVAFVMFSNASQNPVVLTDVRLGNVQNTIVVSAPMSLLRSFSNGTEAHGEVYGIEVDANAVAGGANSIAVAIAGGSGNLHVVSMRGKDVGAFFDSGAGGATSAAVVTNLDTVTLPRNGTMLQAAVWEGLATYSNASVSSPYVINSEFIAQQRGQTSGGGAATNSTSAGGHRTSIARDTPDQVVNFQFNISASSIWCALAVSFEPGGVEHVVAGSPAGSATVTANLNRSPTKFVAGNPNGLASVTGDVNITPAVGDDPLVAAVAAGSSVANARLQQPQRMAGSTLNAGAFMRIAPANEATEQFLRPIGDHTDFTFSSTNVGNKLEQRVNNVSTQAFSDDIHKLVTQDPEKTRFRTVAGQLHLVDRETIAGEPTAANETTDLTINLVTFDQWKQAYTLSPPGNLPASQQLRVELLGTSNITDDQNWHITLRLFETGAPDDTTLYDSGEITIDTNAEYGTQLKRYSLSQRRPPVVKKAMPNVSGKPIKNWANLKLEVRYNNVLGFGGQTEQYYLWSIRLWVPLGASYKVGIKAGPTPTAVVTGSMGVVNNIDRLAATPSGGASIVARTKHAYKPAAAVVASSSVVASLTRIGAGGGQAAAGSPAGSATVVEIRRVLLASTPVGTSMVSAAVRLARRLMASPAGAATVSPALSVPPRMAAMSDAGASLIMGPLNTGDLIELMATLVCTSSTSSPELRVTQGVPVAAPVFGRGAKPGGKRTPQLG